MEQIELVPLEIVGVDPSTVGSPRADGTSGSGLYSVPIRLSRSVSYEEGALLSSLWDAPPEFTSMHRPGTARVVRDEFILTATTIDEVASHHARTLRLVVDAFNERMPQLLADTAAKEAGIVAATAHHKEHVAEVAAALRFD
jgi:hypothetical protein